VNPARSLIKGAVCGVRVEDIEADDAEYPLSGQIARRVGTRKSDGKNLEGELIAST
jgi:hypothetical protein